MRRPGDVAAANTGSGFRPSSCRSQTRGTPSGSSVTSSSTGPMRVRWPLSRPAMITSMIGGAGVIAVSPVQNRLNYAWVARRFAMSRRRDTLSFGHHADVPGQDPDRHDWVVLSLQIRIPPGQLATCRAAAERANLSIEAWTVRALKHAGRRRTGPHRDATA
jgi:hypothetical protein